MESEMTKETGVIKTYDPRKGYSVKAGEVIGNVFRKEVKRHKHYFRIVEGYGIQADVMEELKRRKIKKILIKETDTGDVLVSDLENWKIHEGKGNWGHGRQFVLSEKYMQKNGGQDE